MGIWEQRALKNSRDIENLNTTLKKVDGLRLEGLKVTKTNLEKQMEVISNNGRYVGSLEKRHQIYFIIGGILILLIIIYNIIQLFIN